MRYHEFLIESQLSDFCRVSTNFSDADFWVVRRGSEDAVGKPTKEFNPEHIGIKVTATDRLDPQFLYYALLNLHNQGYWQSRAHGTLRLKNIRSSDLANITMG